MKVRYRKKFLTDLARIPGSQRKAIAKFAFEDLPALNTLAESGKVERLKGSKNCYKVRFGSYRIGLKLEHDTASTRARGLALGHMLSPATRACAGRKKEAQQSRLLKGETL